MLTSNILLAPGNHRNPAYPPLYPKSVDLKNNHNNNNNFLPPLDYNTNNNRDFSSPNLAANQRQLSAATVLPNLKSVIENLSSENLNLNPRNSGIANMKTFNSGSGSTNINNSSHYNGTYQQANMNGQASNSSVSQFLPRSSVYPHPQQPQSNSTNSNTPVKFIINRGATIYQGDHVSIRGSDSQVYFAVVMDFWLTVNGRRYCTLRWLIPKPNHSFSAPLQDRFHLGPIHEKVEAMESILDVFYSPYRNQMSSDSIRRKFILSANEIDGSNTISNNSNKDSLNVVEPPIQLIKAIKSMELASSSSSPSSSPVVSAQNFYNAPSSPSSHLFKSSSPEEDVSMNPIAESHEIAAKMLLSMN